MQFPARPKEIKRESNREEGQIDIGDTRKLVSLSSVGLRSLHLLVAAGALAIISATSGAAVPLILSIGGVTSNTVTIAVQ